MISTDLERQEKGLQLLYCGKFCPKKESAYPKWKIDIDGLQKIADRLQILLRDCKAYGSTTKDYKRRT